MAAYGETPFYRREALKMPSLNLQHDSSVVA